MTKLTLTIAAFVLPFAANAGVVDLTDMINPVDPDVTSFTVTVNGVTFTFSDAGRPGAPASFLHNIDTETGDVTLDGFAGPGLQLGGGGFSARFFTLSVSEDVSLIDYTVDQRLGSGVTLSVMDGMTTLTSGNDVSTDGTFGFGNAPVGLTSGIDYTIDFENTGSAKVSALEAFSFEIEAAPVPLPAGMPLLVGGVGAFAWMRRRAA